MSRLACTNIACSMRDQSINTERTTCIACGRSLSSGLTSGLSDLFDGLLGKSLSGGGTERSPIPSDVLNALRDAETVLASFVSGSPVKRSELEAAHNNCLAALRRFG